MTAIVDAVVVFAAFDADSCRGHCGSVAGQADSDHGGEKEAVEDHRCSRDVFCGGLRFTVGGIGGHKRTRDIM